MSGIHTPIPLLAVVLWALLALALAVLRHASLHPALTRGTCWSITTLRLVALALVGVVLVQP